MTVGPHRSRGIGEPAREYDGAERVDRRWQGGALQGVSEVGVAPVQVHSADSDPPKSLVSSAMASSQEEATRCLKTLVMVFPSVRFQVQWTFKISRLTIRRWLSRDSISRSRLWRSSALR